MNSPTKTKQKTVSIGGTDIPPGGRLFVDLPVANLYTHTSLNMPVQVVNGRQPGPTLFVSAAIHGDELNGVEIVRRLLAQKSLPDRRDLNRSGPGSAKGSVASRLAHTFAEQIILQSDYGIDMHTGAQHRANLPQIRANLDDPATLQMAQAFNVPLMINAQVRDGSLRGFAAENNIPTLLYEAGEALRFDEVSIRAGLRGVLNVMRHLDMLPARKRQIQPAESLIATSTNWVRAAASGIVRSRVKLGQRVAKGALLATISDPFGEVETAIEAPCSGIIIGNTNLPLAHEGDALMHIARFDSVALAQDMLEEFQTNISPDQTPDIG